MIIAPRYLWQDGVLHQGRALVVERGRLVGLRDAQGATPDVRPHLVMPGCTDLQVNGGGGVMFNDNPTPEGLARIVDAHRRKGTAEIMATVITDHPETTAAAADAVASAWGMPGLMGLHIEGPHIAPERKGTHDADRIRPLDRRTCDLVARLRAQDIPVMLTLAPERADPALLDDVLGTGAVVSIGHSAATAAQTRDALNRGVTCFTHLYNAMPPMTSRDPGLLGTAILSEAYCGLIADGIHVDWDMLRLALAARPRADRTFLVSDAMATVGGPDHFDLYGQRIHVKDGALINAEGLLAGAHLDMVTALANIHRHAGVPLTRAVAMATDVPRAAMGLPPRGIAEGQDIDTILALDEALSPMAISQ